LGFSLTKGALMQFLNQQIKKEDQDLQQQIMKKGQDSRVVGQTPKSAASEAAAAA